MTRADALSTAKSLGWRVARRHEAHLRRGDQALSAKILLHLKDRLLEVPMFKQPHRQRRPFACQLPALVRPASIPKSKRDSGFKEARRRWSAAGFFPISSPIAPTIARTRGGSESMTFIALC